MTIPSPHDVAEAARLTRVAEILRRKVTVGWVLLVAGVIFLSVTLIAYSVKANFNADQDRVDQALHDTCVTGNERRADAQTVAEADVETDRAIWQAIDDLIPDGLPEPARTVIFSGLDNRLTRIETTYKRVACPKAPGEPSSSD